jgi:hypothetical protein
MSDEEQKLRARISQLEEASGSRKSGRGKGPQAEMVGISGEGFAPTEDVENVGWSWETFDDGPIFYRNFAIQLFRTGDWKTWCNVEDRSRHSDWDVWVDLLVESRVTGAKVFDIKEVAWFQDLDVGERFDKFASGFSPQVRDYWSDLTAGVFYATFTCHRRRDN